MKTESLGTGLEILARKPFKISETDYAELLEFFKKKLIEMEDISFSEASSASSSVSIRIFSAVRQISMGLLYHLPDSSDQSVSINRLKQKIQKAQTRYKEQITEKKQLLQSLDIVDSNILVIEKELHVLNELEKHKTVRRQLKESCKSTAAWQEILDIAAARVPAKRKELEALSIDTKKQIKRQEELLRNDLELQEEAEKILDKNIFK